MSTKAKKPSKKHVANLKWYKLTDGQVTTDADKYLKSWYGVLSPISSELDLAIHSFDPTVMFVTTDYKQTIHMPLWFAMKLQKLIKELRCLRRKQKNNH